MHTTITISLLIYRNFCFFSVLGIKAHEFVGQGTAKSTSTYTDADPDYSNKGNIPVSFPVSSCVYFTVLMILEPASAFSAIKRSSFFVFSYHIQD